MLFTRAVIIKKKEQLRALDFNIVMHSVETLGFRDFEECSLRAQIRRALIIRCALFEL